MFKTLLLATVCLVLSGCNGCLQKGNELDRAKNQYPVIHYQGPKVPPTVSFQKTMPSTWTSFKEISKVAVGAVLVSEDWAFYQHAGIDTQQIKEAFQRDVERGRLSHGASTITQQVVRNLFLDKDKNFVRKIREALLAIELEKKVTKTRILELYFNIAEWGEGMYGIGPASEFYFHKPPSELSAKEGAFLAMLLPSPKKYSQSYRSHQLTAYASKTIRNILNKMVKAHYLTEDERAFEGTRKLSFELREPQVGDSAADGEGEDSSIVEPTEDTEDDLQGH